MDLAAANLQPCFNKQTLKNVELNPFYRIKY